MLFKGFRLSAKIGKVQALLMKEDYESAISLINTILAQDPSRDLELVALNQKGEAEFKLGNNEQALMCFNKAINIYKSFPKAEPIDKNNQVIGRAVQFIEYINANKT